MGSSTRHSTGPAGGSSPYPAIVSGSLVHVVGHVAFSDFRRAACAWSALEADRAEAMELQLKAKHEAQDAAVSPLRRCEDCQLNLGTRPGDTLRAAFACPRFGKPRVGVESRCSAFVAKGGAP